MSDAPPVEAVSASWRARLRPYAQPDRARALRELAVTAVPYALGWAGLLATADCEGVPSQLLRLALAPLMAGLFVRLFLIEHDCGHNAFLPTRRANVALGTLLGVFTFTPFIYWQRAHGQHHANHANLDKRGLGDFDTLTVREYRALSPLRQRAYRLLRNLPFLMLVGAPIKFLVEHRLPFAMPRTWRRAWRNVAFTNLGIAAWALAAHALVGIGTLAALFAPILVIAWATAAWFLYVQHHFERNHWVKQDSWSFDDAALRGSSHFDVPPWLHWFTANIGYHHVHHLSPRVPFYHLPRAHAAFPEAFQDVPTFTLLSSLACARMKLWDEDRQRMVGFDALDALD